MLPHLADPYSILACGRILQCGIVTNKKKSLWRLVGDRLICHFEVNGITVSNTDYCLWAACGGLQFKKPGPVRCTEDVAVVKLHVNISIKTAVLILYVVSCAFTTIKKTTTLQCVLPTCQHPRRNPLLLLCRSDGESSKSVPAWAPSLGPCRPLIWLPAWPITPPAKGAYVVAEVAAGNQRCIFHTVQDAGPIDRT